MLMKHLLFSSIDKDDVNKKVPVLLNKLNSFRGEDILSYILHLVTKQVVTRLLKILKESQLMARQSYSKEEKLKYVQLFAKSGL